jgi:hypothetical protein
MCARGQVLCLQTFRFLLKHLAAREASAVPYLVPSTLDVLLRRRARLSCSRDALSLELLRASFEHLAASKVVAAAARMEAAAAAAVARGVEHAHAAAAAFDAAREDGVRAALAHAAAAVLGHFVDAVGAAADGSGGGGGDGVGATGAAVLARLCALYALSTVERSLGDFLEAGFFGVEDVPHIRGAVRGLLEVRAGITIISRLRLI